MKRICLFSMRDRRKGGVVFVHVFANVKNLEKNKKIEIRTEIMENKNNVSDK